MRETKVLIPRTAREDYYSPGGPDPDSKVSPLRGLKQRWAVGGADEPFLYRTRADAMHFFKKMPVEMQKFVGLPHRVFV